MVSEDTVVLDSNVKNELSLPAISSVQIVTDVHSSTVVHAPSHPFTGTVTVRFGAGLWKFPDW